MSTAIVLSPHLDDAAFSCGGLMAVLADLGWRVVMVTAFTRSVCPARGFALACQLDKGLGPEVDYMALRRAEDRVAARSLGAELRWLDLLEAPHRGYDSAAALFGPALGNDTVWRTLGEAIAALCREVSPDLVLAPQGLGGHVDHRQMIRALGSVEIEVPLAFYRDTPYAIRNTGALPNVTGDELTEYRFEIGEGLARKVAASCAYASQVGFQFGGALEAAAALEAFALSEGNGVAAERYLGRELDRIGLKMTPS